jgi:hypothetical protein
MNGGRIALLITGVAIAALSISFVTLRWEDANKIATCLSALAGVAAVGVAAWAAWPTLSTAKNIRVSRSGKAMAGPNGRANTGFSGFGGVNPQGIEISDTGDAEGGDANSGVEFR